MYLAFLLMVSKMSSQCRRCSLHFQKLPIQTIIIIKWSGWANSADIITIIICDHCDESNFTIAFLTIVFPKGINYDSWPPLHLYTVKINHNNALITQISISNLTFDQRTVYTSKCPWDKYFSLCCKDFKASRSGCLKSVLSILTLSPICFQFLGGLSLTVKKTYGRICVTRKHLNNNKTRHVSRVCLVSLEKNTGFSFSSTSFAYCKSLHVLLLG